MRTQSFKVVESGRRLDQFLTESLADYSRSHVQGLIAKGDVTVDGERVPASYKLRGGETVMVGFPAPAWPEAEDFEGWVVHEDADLLVLNKPAGLLMHPLGDSWLSAPEAALAESAANLAGLLQLARKGADRVPRCGIVHRLDRQTSGVLLVAKTRAAYESLVGGFKDREISKTYRAIVRGVLAHKNSRVEAPIGRKPGHRKVAVSAFGKDAETAFSVVEAGVDIALVEARPLTGRTHQIRAHLAYLGHPVAGDPEFDKGEPKPPRTMLHAYKVSFDHPKSGKKVAFTAPVPADMKAFWTFASKRAKVVPKPVKQRMSCPRPNR